MKHTSGPSISALIIAHNESSMIEACIDTVSWCDEVLLIDCGSTDDTAALAESKGAKVISFNHPSFSRLREEALKRSSGNWVFYLDADERVTPTLAKEIQVSIETKRAAVLQMRRSNIYFGTHLAHGGWGDDAVTRVFERTALLGWYGEIHESPKYSGAVVALNAPLVHLTHRSVVSGLNKSARWTPMEAKALYDAGAPPVTFLTLLRKGGMEFVRRVIIKKGYQDGLTGLVEATIQAINRVLVYMQVWELQQRPPIAERYQKIEQDIANQWNHGA